MWCPVALEFTSVWYGLMVFICMSLYIPGLRRVGVM